jgi:hypothetical protein
MILESCVRAMQGAGIYQNLIDQFVKQVRIERQAKIRAAENARRARKPHRDRAAENARYYAANREKFRAQRRAYFAANPEQPIFFAAKQRCTDTNRKNYKDYGGRGIEFRLTSVEAMIAEIGKRPSGVNANGYALYSLDRINNDGHYEHGNIRWATRAEQQRNQRRKL